MPSTTPTTEWGQLVTVCREIQYMSAHTNTHNYTHTQTHTHTHTHTGLYYACTAKRYPFTHTHRHTHTHTHTPELCRYCETLSLHTHTHTGCVRKRCQIGFGPHPLPNSLFFSLPTPSH